MVEATHTEVDLEKNEQHLNGNRSGHLAWPIGLPE